MKENIAQHMNKFDAPIDSEFVIKIDGMIEFSQQFTKYEQQLAAILERC
jgi:hypothetical protein